MSHIIKSLQYRRSVQVKPYETAEIVVVAEVLEGGDPCKVIQELISFTHKELGIPMESIKGEVKEVKEAPVVKEEAPAVAPPKKKAPKKKLEVVKEEVVKEEVVKEEVVKEEVVKKRTKNTPYDRNNIVHKTLLISSLRSFAPLVFTDKYKGNVKGVSEELEGEDFLGINGAVLESFLQLFVEKVGLPIE